jgi:hypothetical protein
MKSSYVNKAQWVELFQAIGLTDEKMARWHREFEERNPKGHQEFLEWLNIPNHEINEIRVQ